MRRSHHSHAGGLIDSVEDPPALSIPAGISQTSTFEQAYSPCEEGTGLRSLLSQSILDIICPQNENTISFACPRTRGECNSAKPGTEGCRHRHRSRDGDDGHSGT